MKIAAERLFSSDLSYWLVHIICDMGDTVEIVTSYRFISLQRTLLSLAEALTAAFFVEVDTVIR